MTRAPCLRFSNVAKAVEAKAWIESPENYQIIKQAFDSQSRFARLQRLRCRWGFHELFKNLFIFTLTFWSCLILLTWMQWHGFFFSVWLAVCFTFGSWLELVTPWVWTCWEKELSTPSRRWANTSQTWLSSRSLGTYAQVIKDLKKTFLSFTDIKSYYFSIRLCP